jgi:hypothetical protein
MRVYGIVGFAVGTFIILIVSTIIPGMHTSEILKDTNQELIISSDQKFYGSLGLPDLIIEDIKIYPTNPFEEEFRCQVKNIGDASTPYGKAIDISVIVRWKILNLLPLIRVREFTGGTIGSGLAPGEIDKIPFASTSIHMPLFGYYMFYCKVNPQYIIEESNYQNNFYTETVFFILGLSHNS